MRRGGELAKKVLVSIKQTRLETESNRLNLSGSQLDDELTKRGFNLTKLHSSHQAHIRSKNAVYQALESRDIEFFVEHARDLSEASTAGVDFVICVGGDGTFLETAQFVKTPDTPVLGVNSDPLSSTGKLCAIALRKPNDFEKYFNRIEQENFSWYLRSRVGVTLTLPNGKLVHPNVAAVNEMLFAEKEVCRPTMHQTKIDNGNFGPAQKSCGVLVCSGSGSTAWMKSASCIRADDAELVLKEAGVHFHTEHMAEKVTSAINREFMLSAHSENVLYFVRESLSFNNASAPRRGIAKKVAIRSLGFDTQLFMDGLAKFRVENGTVVHLEIDPARALKTFVF